ncbi:MAG: chemotaxis response regulator protein-glutamate methylesterase [Lachnospiraceae bacterium]|nr:chemotaxis response regulator protein-glutamate methylesterase [Lachnospiraceae bacterium]
MRKIKVLVVEDSMLFRELLVQNLNRDPGIEVVAAARDPFEARDMILKHQPDVMTLDIELPRMNGIEFLQKLMPQYPLPVVMISSLSDRVFDAMNAGAVEFVAKPTATNRQEIEDFIRTELPVKIKIASVAKVRRAPRTDDVAMGLKRTARTECDLIAIGASTGGTEATAELLKGLRGDVPGIVIVQHMPAGFTELYANRLNERGELEVREAKNGDVVKPGLALLAPGGDQHMKLIRQDGEYKVVLKKAPKVNGHCPSVDVLFHSVAEVAGRNAMGVILTGMGGDGAKGLLEMRRRGARTIGQDESTCVVYGMPKVAYENGAVEYQEKLPNISTRIYSILNNKV